MHTTTSFLRAGAATYAAASFLLLAGCGGGDPAGPQPPADVATIEVVTSTGSSADTLAALGATVHLEATARDADGDPVPGVEVEWTTTDETVATVDGEGVVTAVGNGEADVAASAGEATGSVALAVSQAVETVSLTPSTAVLTSVGATQTFSVSSVDSNDNPVEGVRYLWQTSDPAVAVVDTTGRAVARAPGQVTITAAAQGVPGHAGLTVAPEGTRLVFDRQPSDGAVDEALPPLRVAVEDDVGNRVPVDGLDVTVTLASNPGGATLSGTATAPTSGGVAEFGGLRLDAWGEGFTLEATAGGLDAATSAPFDVELLFDQVAAGTTHSCGVTPASAIFCWGEGRALGVEIVTAGEFRPTPQRVLDPASGPVVWKRVTAGRNFSCGITAGGDAYCWGTNFAGQLGDGTTVPRGSPTRVADPSSGPVAWSVLSAGSYHVCGIASDGRAFCWGSNQDGKLGDGTTTERHAPTRVADPSSGPVAWSEIVAAYQNTCGRDDSDRVFCWGDNEFGQIGDDTTTDRYVPTRPSSILAMQVAVDVAVGSAHVCALDPDRDFVECWGDNRSGQLGSGLVDAFVYDRVEAGDSRSCGVTVTGDAVCWGSAPRGNGESSSGSDPVLVSDPPAGSVVWEDLSSSSFNHVCGVTDSGAGYCWGRNDEGQLGDGTFSRALAPVRIGG